MTTEPNNSAEQEPTVRMAAYDHLAKLHRKLEAENTRLKAELERANGLLALILKDAPIAECNDFHHAKPDRHEGFDCPVHKRWTAALAAACSHLNPKKTP